MPLSKSDSLRVYEAAKSFMMLLVVCITSQHNRTDPRSHPVLET